MLEVPSYLMFYELPIEGSQQTLHPFPQTKGGKNERLWKLWGKKTQTWQLFFSV